MKQVARTAACLAFALVAMPPSWVIYGTWSASKALTRLCERGMKCFVAAVESVEKWSRQA